jgi:hypothetical protein
MKQNAHYNHDKARYNSYDSARSGPIVRGWRARILPLTGPFPCRNGPEPVNQRINVRLRNRNEYATLPPARGFGGEAVIWRLRPIRNCGKSD